ncbi:MAG: penicillin-binding protein A [Oscillospiraceae bacterium]|jgi:penicillin-binding protein 2|nr:penicillin-binding protein A [Oscillospiraceae bacterium]
MRIINPFRLTFLALLPAVLAVICILGLYNLQIVHGEEYYERSRSSIVTKEVIPASRGSILDRYGRVLVSNRVSYNVAIDRSRLVAGGSPNGVILELITNAADFGVPYVDNSPLDTFPPYGVKKILTNTQQNRYAEYMGHMKLDPENYRQDLFTWLCKHYSIPEDFSEAEARLVIGVRYELELRTLFHYAPYYFAEDVALDYIAQIEERSYSGVSMERVSVREYNTDYAAHILGRVGPMDTLEYEKYSEFGYPMNALVGKDGLEKAFEAELHGEDGARTITRNEEGAITGVLETKEPKPGNNVVLAIDIELQQVAELELANIIESVNAERVIAAEENPEKAQAPIPGGAVVVMKIGTGELLGSASYPTFNQATFNRDYSTLLEDSRKPLYNRALQGAYEPGSTFKPVTALGALNERIISETDTIYDKGIYTEYQSLGYTPTCWLYPLGSHGTINVVEAITFSCNYFFYEIGIRLKIEKLSYYAEQFGFGKKTGTELEYESAGTVASSEYKNSVVGVSWYPGDTLQAAIGQSYNQFTPVQLASYCATIANSGVRNAAHFLKSVKTRDNSTTVREYEAPEVPAVDADPYCFLAIQKGMRGVVTNYSGTAHTTFGNYDIPVAAKTGTVQFGKDMENNAVFIAYAPYENPEIAVAVVVEKGGSGASVANIAKAVFENYFSSKSSAGALEGEGTLLR